VSDELAFAGLAGQADLLERGEASSRELVECSLARIAASQPILNAFRCVRDEAALAEASAADRRRAAGEQLPLLGVPVAITSPGSSVVNDERCSIVRGTSKIICEVRADCITSPLRRVVSSTSETSTSSTVTSSGPIGIVASKFLPAVHWLAARCHSRALPSLTTTHPAIAASASAARM